jgi:beta-lactamase class A
MLAMLLAFLLLWLPLPAIAVPLSPPSLMAQLSRSTPEQVLNRLFQTETISSDWFAPSFLEQVTVDQVQSLVQELSSSLGELVEIVSVPQGYEITFAEGIVPASIHLGTDNKIDGLFFGVPEVPIALNEAVQSFEQFTGEASLLVLKMDAIAATDETTDLPVRQVLAELNPDLPLAVGSAFKLAVLAAVQEAIANGSFSWDQVVTLRPEWKSLPSGLLQEWPANTAVTIETLATLMMSISDNTATDALINLVGRDQVEAWTQRNQPFLTTREAFALKNPANQRQLDAYRRGSVEQRRQRLEKLDTASLPDVNLFNDMPIALDVEWHFTARELCELMAQVHDLPLMQINPGVAKPQHWQKIAFKGGSEPGVVNMTTWLEAQDGTTYCVTATGNNATQTVNLETFIRLYQGILLGLEKA